MGTTAQKLEYLGTTKSQLKDMINYGLPTENQITNETTFRNYVKSIFEAFLESLRDSTTLYTNLPKISGNGTQITLNDTANAPMRITLKASELTQDATPTPDTPQDIHTISGSNSIVVEGKNLFDKDSFTYTNGWYNDNGVLQTSTLTSHSTNYIKVKSNTIYTISGFRFDTNTSYSTIQRVYYWDSSKNWISRSESYNAHTKGTFTTPNNCEYITLQVNTNNEMQYTITDDLGTIQLELGSTSTTYEPYVSQTAPINLGNIEYCKIGDYEDKFILTSGKNLFDKATTNTNKSINDGNGSLNNSSLSSASDFIEIKGNTQYIVSGYGTSNYYKVVAYYNSEKTFISSNYETNSNNTYSITTPNNAKYLRFHYLTTNENQIMLNKGTTTLPYEPYGTNQWYLKKNIGKVVLTGSYTENWVLETTKEITQVFNSNNTISNRLMSNRTFFSNYFINQAGDTEKISFVTDNNSVYIALNKTTANSVEKLRTWLSTHNTEIYYVLSTPTYTQITGTLETQLNNIYKNMLSYKGTTNISQVNNDLPFVLGVSALEDFS